MIIALDCYGCGGTSTVCDHRCEPNQDGDCYAWCEACAALLNALCKECTGVLPEQAHRARLVGPCGCPEPGRSPDAA